MIVTKPGSQGEIRIYREYGDLWDDDTLARRALIEALRFGCKVTIMYNRYFGQAVHVIDDKLDDFNVSVHDRMSLDQVKQVIRLATAEAGNRVLQRFTLSTAKD